MSSSTVGACGVRAVCACPARNTCSTARTHIAMHHELHNPACNPSSARMCSVACHDEPSITAYMHSQRRCDLVHRMPSATKPVMCPAQQRAQDLADSQQQLFASFLCRLTPPVSSALSRLGRPQACPRFAPCFLSCTAGKRHTPLPFPMHLTF